METLCPVCNGLATLSSICIKCHGVCADQGNVINYFGPYAPYQDIKSYAITQSLVEPEQERCIHTMRCGTCGELQRQPVEYICL